ncbi:MAG TPA: heparan-alpha-glucosaminide N-acetyltransferase domain-containing protein [Emticicia sp.]
MKRINSIDFTRGLVMVIMAIDHCRDLLHIGINPTDLTVTTPFLFFTRWITHLCAPTFVFLSGTSAYLSYKNQNASLKESQRFMLSRGIWLIILEFTIIGFALWFDFKFRMFFFQVIGAIGLGFIILSFLMKLTPKTILIIGLAIIFGHNLLGLLPFNETPYSYFAPLFSFSLFQVTPNTTFAIGYPPIPWLGIMLAGYGMGGLVFNKTQSDRKATLLKLGLGSLALFAIIRFINIYGDPVPWSPQKDAVFTFMSFMNLTKYPPSLLYTLATLGISFIILSVSDGAKNKFIDIMTVYGKVPLFYYLIHWYLIHSIMFVMLYMQGFQYKDFVFGPFQFGRPQQPSGLELGGVYLVWLAVVISLYPLCKWYSNYKAAHKDIKWLRYL